MNVNPSALARTDCQRLSNFQEALADLSQIAIGDITVETLFKVVGSRLAQIVPADYVSIMMVEADQRLVLSAGVGWDKSQIGTVLAKWDADSDPEYPPVLRGPVVDANPNVPPLIDGLVPAGGHLINCAQSVPIGRLDRPLGALGIYVKEHHSFSPYDLTFMKSVASVLAAKIEQANTAHQIDKATKDEGYLTEIGRIVGASLDMQEVYSLFAHQARKLIDFDRITINLIDRVNQSFNFAYVAGAEEADWPSRGPHPITGKAIDAVLQLGHGVIVQHDNKVEFRAQYPGALSDHPGFNSLLCAPVYWRGEIIAVLALLSKRINPYAKKDLDAAVRIAAQIAGAIANSSLHASEKLYAEEQSALAEISRIIVSSVRLDEIYPRFAEAAKRLLKFDRIVINTIDEQHTRAFLRHTWGRNVDDNYSRQSGRPLAAMATAVVARSQMGLIVSPEMVSSDPERFGALQKGLDAGLVSTIVAPLIYQGRTFGTLTMRCTEKDAYDLRELHLAEQIALQISGVVWSSQINKKLERSVDEFSMLAELANSASTARVLNTFLENVNDALRQCMEFDHIAICIEQPEYSIVRYEYVRGVKVDGIEDGAVLPVSSIAELPEYVSAHYGEILAGNSRRRMDPARKHAGLNSYIQFPLLSRGRPIGIIYLGSQTPDAYSSSHLDLMEKVGTQIACAIDNIRYYDNALQETSNRIALDDLITSIGRSTSHREMLTTFLGILRNAIPYDCVSFSPVSSKYEPLAKEIAEIVNGFDAAKPISTSLVEELTRMTIEQGEVVLLDANHLDSSKSPDLFEKLENSNYASCLSIPLISAGSQIGVLHFYATVRTAFSSDHSRTAALAGTILLSALDRTGYTASASDAMSILLPNIGQSRIGIVDRNPICQRSLSVTVKDLGFDVVAETSSLKQFFEIFDHVSYDGQTVLIWELHDPEEADFSLVRQYLKERQNPKIILVDHGCGSELLGDALRSGVVGYLQRDSSIETLETALVNVLDAGVSIDRNILDNYFQQNSIPSFRWSGEYSAILEQLDDRDLAILKAVANGQSNAEIANELSFAVGTIKNRLARIYKFLGVADRAGAMVFAIRAGVVV